MSPIVREHSKLKEHRLDPSAIFFLFFIFQLFQSECECLISFKTYVFNLLILLCFSSLFSLFLKKHKQTNNSLFFVWTQMLLLFGLLFGAAFAGCFGPIRSATQVDPRYLRTPGASSFCESSCPLVLFRFCVFVLCLVFFFLLLLFFFSSLFIVFSILRSSTIWWTLSFDRLFCFF